MINKICKELKSGSKSWLVTGVAGFIGSNLLEGLLDLGQTVIGLDNFSTGHRHNLEAVQACVGAEAWSRFRFIEGDIGELEVCTNAVKGIDYVLHQAALGSVPRSIDEPIRTNRSNVDGFLNMLVASRDARVRRFVYAASSSTYGDHPDLPKKEDIIGRPLSPYAVTKYVNELYAEVFGRCFGFESIGLRYFNVFGRRQDPNGAYAAVIPKWIGELMRRETPAINGDGKTSRDFCYIDDVVQANILAATIDNKEAVNQVYNIGIGDRTSLDELFRMIRDSLVEFKIGVQNIEAVHKDFRPGDVRHSQADISKAARLLGYKPSHTVDQGIIETVRWSVHNLRYEL